MPIEKLTTKHGTTFRPKEGGYLQCADRQVMFGVNIHTDSTHISLHASGIGGFSMSASLGALDARRLGQALLDAAATLAQDGPGFDEFPG